MSDETVLRVNNLSVFYGNLQVIWDLSLTVGAGELVALVGSNGAGKTTLLDAISGLHCPQSGKIEYEGRDITGLDPYQIVSLGISHIPENRELFPELTVLDNLVVGSYNRQARMHRDKNLEMVMTHFPILRERKRQLAKTLSGGQQQMLAIGRGLMADPKLLLIDEMSLGLAPIIQTELYLVLKEIKSRGISILLVEQNVRRSLCEADRAYVMERGKMVLSGTAEELRECSDVKNAYFGLACQDGVEGMSFLSDLATPVLMGILLGGLYALIAIGLSLVFGVMRLINVAHGDLVIFSTYFAYSLFTWFGIDPLLSLVAGAPIMFGLGFLIQKFLMKRSFGISMEAPLIIAFGLSLVLQNLYQIMWTPLSRGFNVSYAFEGVGIGDVYLPLVYFLDFGAAVIVILGLREFLKRTYLGKAISAATQNKRGAMLIGIHTDRIYALTFAIAMGVSAIAGVFLGLSFPFSPTTGVSFLIISFGVIVVGGLGSMLGTFVGGIILGLAQTLGGYFFGDAAQMLIAYLIVLVALSVRPQGIFGR